MYRPVRPVLAIFLLALLSLPWVGCATPNTPPGIVSLTSRDHVIAPGDSVLIECVAEDADGDELTYEWTCDRGVINGHTGVIAWTAPAEEGLARVTVDVSDGGEETVSQSITVIVRSNVSPAITGLTADLDWVRPGASTAVHCTAEDLDGDSLTYTWSTTGGQISGGGETVTWTAPDTENESTITVLVEDGYDGRASTSLSIVTSQYEPLLVTSMTVTAVDEPAYIMLRNESYKVYWGDNYVIDCTVSEPGRIVSYEWSDGTSVAVFPVGAERIVFESGPAQIRWTAPKERSEVVITVTAKDAAGNYASKSLTLQVETCTCAFPKPEVEEPQGQS